ncbi:serine hydrolase [Lacrimispora sp.]|uniref:serine hydrolase n=1 Tax=Lacrimispora sp. TaxID=2719234 RepID=UPI0028A7513F|nr:serine hydrolase [Lacrimispora sp.]
MAKKSCRLWSLVISISILASIPSYGEMPLIQPFPGAAGQTGTASGSSGSTANEVGPGVNTGAGAGGSQTGNIPNAGGTLPSDIKQPEIQSEGAVLMDASTGALLFSKNGETRYYPASVTKLMTALLVAEKSNLSETVTFSKTATTNLESGAVTLGLTEGDKLTVEQSLYGLMLKSANEVANGLAEHVSGSVSAFSALMNARAKELGCTGTNFVNPNGLNSSSHYTTPHDMALIARAAFQNDTVRKVSSTLSYQIPATKKASARTVTMGHKMVNPGDSRYYPGVIGGKTGYTSLAGNTLVTCVEKNGVRLIAVIMKSKSTHYEDTKSLLDYGFALKTAGGGTAQTSSQGWVQEGSKWYYRKQDGTKASNEWQKIDGIYYWFGTDSVMAASRWVESNGKWFYLGTDGAMLKDTITPDGYRLDSSGAWIR